MKTDLNAEPVVMDINKPPNIPGISKKTARIGVIIEMNSVGSSGSAIMKIAGHTVEAVEAGFRSVVFKIDKTHRYKEEIERKVSILKRHYSDHDISVSYVDSAQIEELEFPTFSDMFPDVHYKGSTYRLTKVEEDVYKEPEPDA